MESQYGQKYAKYVKIFLRNSWENLGKIFRNWFWRTFLWKFPRISTTLVNIFSVYSPELVTKNSLELITRNFLDRVMRSSPEWGREIPRNGLREIPLNFCQHISPDFPVKDSWEFRKCPVKISRNWIPTLWHKKVLKC